MNKEKKELDKNIEATYKGTIVREDGIVLECFVKITYIQTASFIT